MTFEDWMVSVYQGQHAFKNPEQALRSAWDAAAAAERDKYEAKFKQLEALMQAREQQPNKPCCLAERKAIEPIVYGLCMSDNNAQEIVDAIRKRGQE